MTKKNKQENNPWFDNSEGEGEKGSPADDKEPQSSLAELMATVLTGSPIDRDRIDQVIAETIGKQREPEALTGEEQERAQSMIDRSVEMARGKTSQEINELWATVTSARILMAHCEDCGWQVIETLRDILKNTPVKSIMKAKKKYNIPDAQGESEGG